MAFSTEMENKITKTSDLTSVVKDYLRLNTAVKCCTTFTKVITGCAIAPALC